MSSETFLPMLPNVSTIGHVVRAERKSRGLSQQELADLAGVSRKWLSELENAKPNAEIKPVLAVLQALGFTLQLAKQPTPAFDLQEHISRYSYTDES